jgi:hypothetical protein
MIRVIAICLAVASNVACCGLLSIADTSTAEDWRLGLVGVYFSSPRFTDADGIFRLDSLDQYWDPDELGSSWSARWEGVVLVPASGEVTVRLNTTLAAEVTIGEQTLRSSGADAIRMQWQEGKLYPLTLAVSRIRSSNADRLQLLWSRHGEAEHPLGDQELRHSASLPVELKQRYPDLVEPPGQPPETTVDAEQVVVHYEPGRFCGWPANSGLWSWGDEIIVAFGYHFYEDKTERGEHSVDDKKPKSSALARSLDGGHTWRLEVPKTLRVSGKEATECPGGIDFQHPDFALQCKDDSFHVSYDRGRTWGDRYRLPIGRGKMEHSSRTDYLAEDRDSCLFFLSAKEPRVQASLQDRAFCARTDDGGRTFEFVSWITGEPLSVRSVMPATVRVGEGHLVSVLRRRADERKDGRKAVCNWIDAYESRDNGQTWQFLSKVATTDTGKRNGNPPALVRTHDGRICVAYGYRATPYGIRARVSSDNGRTWGKELGLRTDGRSPDIGYPRMTVRPDGKLVTVYYFTTDEMPEQHLAATIWSPPADNNY